MSSGREINACHRLLGQQREAIAREDGGVEGFNVGVNDGETAGRTILHCHLHLIPRCRGAVKNPAGGMRNTIRARATTDEPTPEPLVRHAAFDSEVAQSPVRYVNR